MEIEKLSGWQPIETAPKDGTSVLVWTGYSCDVAYCSWANNDGSPAWFNDDVVVKATHWQPLPAPPGTTRAPADLRSALEAETIREAAKYASQAREIAGMLAQSPDGPLRWKQYRLVAMADYLNTLAALAPTKGDVS